MPNGSCGWRWLLKTTLAAWRLGQIYLINTSPNFPPPVPCWGRLGYWTELYLIGYHSGLLQPVLSTMLQIESQSGGTAVLKEVSVLLDILSFAREIIFVYSPRFMFPFICYSNACLNHIHSHVLADNFSTTKVGCKCDRKSFLFTLCRVSTIHSPSSQRYLYSKQRASLPTLSSVTGAIRLLRLRLGFLEVMKKRWTEDRKPECSPGMGTILFLRMILPSREALDDSSYVVH